MDRPGGRAPTTPDDWPPRAAPSALPLNMFPTPAGLPPAVRFSFARGPAMATLQVFRRTAILLIVGCLFACSGSPPDAGLATRSAATVHAEPKNGPPREQS